MNEAIKNMLERRSVRTYTTEQIRDEDLKVILDCALYAPTGTNTQTCRFLVMQEPALLEELNDALKTEFASREIVEGQFLNHAISLSKKEGCNYLYHAPTLITTVSLRNHGNSMADCAAALENMQLAATALGLGSCWINQARWLTDVPAVRAVFAGLGLREDEDIFGSVAVGYSSSATSPKAAARKEGRITLDRPRQL